jgi:iron complex transport system substrate-binding protein
MRLACLYMLILSGCVMPGPGRQTAEERIVSIDYCADQLVLGVVERARIAAVSNEADADPLFSARLSVGMPRVRSDAEHILALRPTLVVRSYAGGQRLEAALERAGVRVHTLPYATTLEDVRAGLITSGRALGAEPAMATRLARFDRDVRQASLRSPMTALYTTPGDYTAGTATLIDDAMRRAGLRNLERRAGWHRLSTEALVASPPAIVLRAFGEARAHRTDRWSGSDHRALRRAFRQSRQIVLPGSWVACGNWRIGHAVAAMRNRQQ